MQVGAGPPSVWWIPASGLEHPRLAPAETPFPILRSLFSRLKDGCKQSPGPLPRRKSLMPLEDLWSDAPYCFQARKSSHRVILTSLGMPYHRAANHLARSDPARTLPKRFMRFGQHAVAMWPSRPQPLVRTLGLCDLLLQSLGDPDLDDGLSCHSKPVGFPVQ